MKLVKASSVLALILVGTMASGSVLAGGGKGHSGGGGQGHSGGGGQGHSGGGGQGHSGGGGQGHSGGGGHANSGSFRSSPSTHFRVFIGGPAFWPSYYYPPYYSYPPYDYYPPDDSPAVEYIEAGSTQPEPSEPQAHWYYCADAKTYYPYVKQCPEGWQQVVPQPPPD
jgi:hypothetical protein